MKRHSFHLLCLSIVTILLTGCVGSEEAPVATNQDGNDSSAKSQFVNMNAIEAAKILKEKPEAVVLDIRTPKEYAEGHIPDAINIDYKADSFQSELEKLDRDTTYLMHCRSGRRSANSLEIFEKLGFRHVIHMDDGILGWQEDLVK